MTKILNISELTSRDNSCDIIGRIYFLDDRIIRVINNDYRDQLIDFFSSGMMQELIEKKLIPNTWISEFTTSDSNLILESSLITRWSYAYEWSFNMLKDAAHSILLINDILNKYGYELVDPHQENITFFNNKPIYIDLGSIRKKYDSAWSGFEAYLLSVYTPLKLMSDSLDSVARSVLRLEYTISPDEGLLIRSCFFRNFPRLAKCFSSLSNNIYRASNLSNSNLSRIKFSHLFYFLKKLAIWIMLYKQVCFNKKLIKMPAPKLSYSWSNYHDNFEISKAHRLLLITDIINTLHDAHSLTEVAANQGKFSEYILDNTSINFIIATDRDPLAVDKMYLSNKFRENFLALVYDCTNPYAIGYRATFPDRMRSDVVLCLALIHHLILTFNIDLDYIFNCLSKLTSKYILIEFMPLGLYSNGESISLPIFYTEDWFKSIFTKYFSIIRIDRLEANRILYVGQLST